MLACRLYLCSARYMCTCDILRIYTAEFGRNLRKAYEAWSELPPADRSDLRVRRSVDASKTDKELFSSLATGDLWLESGVHMVYLYLAGCKYCETLIENWESFWPCTLCLRKGYSAIDLICKYGCMYIIHLHTVYVYIYIYL